MKKNNSNPNPNRNVQKLKVERKRGMLSMGDRAYIQENADKLPIPTIANNLNRNEAPIIQYMERQRLGKTYSKLPAIPTGKTDAQIFKALKSKIFYRNLKEQLSPQELTYFEEHWVQLLLQFNGDLAVSEEMELKELIILEILKNRETVGERDRLRLKNQLESELNAEMRLEREDRNAEAVRELRQRLIDISAASSNYIKNFKDLCDRADKMRKALHASRQDRVKTLENSKIDFIGFLKALEEHGRKLEVGKEMEVIRLAKQYEYEKLAGYHEYADKKVDRPLLTAETVGLDTPVEGGDLLQ